jgi:serine/threonine-protein kinase HipA
VTTVAAVKLWGRHIGAVSQQADRDYAAFQYQPDFAASGIEIAPIVMPLANRVYAFPELARETFRGLPGLLADSLPDKFGNALIDAWLAAQGRLPASFNAVERLCYTGTRGMGALEFEPATGPDPEESDRIEIAALVDLASRVLARQSDLRESLAAPVERASLTRILQVGTSAGGARAKAVIAWNPRTNEVRSGQVEAGTGFEYWLLKFDGVRGNRDKELEDPAGYGAIEYAYHHMAVAAGLTMNPCRLLDEGGRRHFMAKRFDRTDGGGKIHMQSLGALGHFDYNSAGVHSYEQGFALMRQLGLSMVELEQQYRRMTFNIIARNQDDHVKNIAFLMDKQGQWSLAPAFDVTYSYNPAGIWTAVHQMSVNGKRDAFTLDDFKACARGVALKRGRAETIIEEVRAAVAQWPRFAALARVSAEQVEQIQQALRLEMPTR